MANLQYKQQNIRYGKYNFYHFTSKSRDYKFNEILKLIGEVLPEVQEDIKAFNFRYETEIHDKYKINVYGIPLCAAGAGEVVDICETTKNLESFLEFKNYIKSLQNDLSGIREKLKQYNDKEKLSDNYTKGIHYTINTRDELKILKNNKEIGKKVLTSAEKEKISQHYGELNISNMWHLGLMNTYDVVHMLQKDPFAKLLNSELYQANAEDFNFEEEPELDFADSTIYYLAAELPDRSPSFQWVSVMGAGNAVYIGYSPHIQDATPLNKRRLQEVLSTNKNYVCFEYKATVSRTVYTKNSLTQKVDAAMEKKELLKQVRGVEKDNKKSLKI